jgi:hypothetical protein
VRLLYLLPAFALLGGCGGGSAVPQSVDTTPGLSDSPVIPNAQHYGHDSFIVSSQLYGNDATVYKRNGFTLTWKATISYDISMPQGTVTTPNGWWYLTNAGHSNILVYRIKKNSIPQYPSNVLDDYGEMPVDVAATSDRKLVAVSNSKSNSSGAGSVSVYLNRQSEPTRILTYGTDQLQGEGVAIDHQGNCYWSFNDPNTNGGSIVEFTGCNGSGNVVISGLTNAQGIAFDQSGNLYYVDQPFGIYKCAKTSRCSLFVGDTGYFSLPTFINFDYKAKGLWVADASGYLWGIDLKGKCNHGSVCIHRYDSVDGDPYGIAPVPGD